MARLGFFGHNTPCALRADLAAIYPVSCDGGQCACSGAGTTTTGVRVSRFSTSYSGEIIAAGYGDPVAAFYGWLHEQASSAPCGYYSDGYDTNGHRWLILKAGPAVGAGFANVSTSPWRTYYVADFGGGVLPSPVVSGAHYPRQASSVEFWANWYAGAAPSSARVVVEGVSHPLTLARGSATSGAWTAAVTGLGAGCHRYYFEFRDAAGLTFTLPASGSYAVGPAGTCDDWIPSRQTAVTASRDFTGDSRSDLIWRQPSTGRNVWWAMNGAVRLSYGSLVDVPGSDWSIGGVGDFNRDNRPDILWRNRTTGQVVVWIMNGTVRTGVVTLPVVAGEWEVGGVGDLDGDGDADIVWRNGSTGQNVLWTMNGTARQSYTSLPAVAGSQWRIGGVGDLTGDGKADVIWRNYSTGANVSWEMDGGTRRRYEHLLAVADPAWRISAVADYDGDGQSDLVWRNAATGQNVLWIMSGATRKSYLPLLSVPDISWVLAAPR